jgi:hypothetical protein
MVMVGPNSRANRILALAAAGRVVARYHLKWTRGFAGTEASLAG